jgi:hypothetical protein
MLPHARERCDRPPASRLRRRREAPVARNHFGFEKRQRELSKERKKEEKRQRKEERQNVDQADGAQDAGDDPVSVNDGPRATS